MKCKKMTVCRFISLFFAFQSLALTPCLTANAQTKEQFAAEKVILDSWAAGSRISMASVRNFGIDKCFVAEEISDGVFRRMWKKSYKVSCTVPRSSLRYVKVLHYDINGDIFIGELVCDKDISGDLVSIFRQLFNAKYPVGRMVLVDDYGADDEASMAANNTSCFNYRCVSGTKRLSKHSRGRAIDINTLYNPYVKRRSDGTLQVRPSAGKPYADRSKNFVYKISRNDLCYRLFKQHGFMWGGDWKHTKDYQHFEK